MSDDVHITLNDVPLSKILAHDEAMRRRTESEALRQQEIKEHSYRKPVTGGMRPMRKTTRRLTQKEFAEQDKRIFGALRNLPKLGVTVQELIKRSGSIYSHVQAIQSIHRCGAHIWKEKKYQGKCLVGLIPPVGYKIFKGKQKSPVSVAPETTEAASPQPVPMEVESISASVVVTSLENIMKTVCDAQLAFWTTFKKGLEERDATSKDPKTDT